MRRWLNPHKCMCKPISISAEIRLSEFPGEWPPSLEEVHLSLGLLAREIRSEILYSLPAKTEPPFFLLSLFRPAPSRDLTGERERAKFERGRRSPKAEEDVGEGLRAREQREHDPVHHPFHLRTERTRQYWFNSSSCSRMI